MKPVNIIIFLLVAAVICSAFFWGAKIFRHLNKGDALPAESISSPQASASKSGNANHGADNRGAAVNRNGAIKHNAGTVREPGDIRVVMYMTDWCPYCTKTREYIRSQGVHLVEYNIERDRNSAEEMVRKTGGRRGVPVIDVEGIILRGYNPQAIANAIKQKQNG